MRKTIKWAAKKVLKWYSVYISFELIGSYYEAKQRGAQPKVEPEASSGVARVIALDNTGLCVVEFEGVLVRQAFVGYVFSATAADVVAALANAGQIARISSDPTWSYSSNQGWHVFCLSIPSYPDYDAHVSFRFEGHTLVLRRQRTGDNFHEARATKPFRLGEMIDLQLRKAEEAAVIYARRHGLLWKAL